MEEPDEMFEIGYEEYFYGRGVCLVEWAERIPELIPETAVKITVEKDQNRGFSFRVFRIQE
jgi:tRNA threonylcarbamoyladenosine biosynthesis protein TsaE